MEDERNRWLENGGVIVTSTERAARAAVASFNRAQQSAGRAAWASARVFWWDGWLRTLWAECSLDDGLGFAAEGERSGDNLLLSAIQEQSLWSAVIRASAFGSGLMSEERLASVAARSYKLVASYAPAYLAARNRHGWSGEAGVLSEWMDGFTKLCRREKLMSASVLPLALVEWLASQEVDARGERAPVLLVGFDRLLETQRRLLEAWGSWRQEEFAGGEVSGQFLSFADEASEVAACAEWLQSEYARKPLGRWLVIAPGLSGRRGELERALLAKGEDGTTDLRVEFSLGVPLGQTRVARGAYLLLRWLSEALSETELEWLLVRGLFAADGDEKLVMGGSMAELRRRGRERTEWSLESFCDAAERTCKTELHWTERLREAQRRLRLAPERHSAGAWSAQAAEVLASTGWPGFQPLDSAGFQARERWNWLLEECGRSDLLEDSAMEWDGFVALLGAALSVTLFTVESTDGNVLITEPLESAGLVADGVWFLGASEDRWPGEGRANTLLPLSVQREAGMPHASIEGDWQLGDEVTGRILSAAEQVIFSFARSGEEGEVRASKLVLRRCGEPEERSQPEETRKEVAVEVVEDDCVVPCPARGGAGESVFHASGGAGVLSDQSQCPFRAFARTRLGVERWQAAEPGISARQRGILVHDVMQRIWGGAAAGGLETLDDLLALSDRASFVREKVRETMERRRAELMHETIPERLLDMEARRLDHLVAEWLEYEAARRPFTVENTEENVVVRVGGFSLRVRQDRVDVVGDGGRLVIDYKTGANSPSAWTGERPEDMQLPLYGAYGIEDRLEGMVYARLKTGDVGFSGRARDAQSSVKEDLSRLSGLVKTPLTDEDLNEWRRTIERLAEDFLAGHAEVDPKQAPTTCQYCGLESLCRIAERMGAMDEIDGNDNEEDAEQHG
uniref:PD-(D/E)XK endonuclease-like domain-containing protein n=1 Tax=mine drainage metagenome TaxID=410659 RepID=E6PZA2_9ZZZZ